MPTRPWPTFGIWHQEGGTPACHGCTKSENTGARSTGLFWGGGMTRKGASAGGREARLWRCGSDARARLQMAGVKSSRLYVSTESRPRSGAMAGLVLPGAAFNVGVWQHSLSGAAAGRDRSLTVRAADSTGRRPGAAARRHRGRPNSRDYDMLYTPIWENGRAAPLR